MYIFVLVVELDDYSVYLQIQNMFAKFCVVIEQPDQWTAGEKLVLKQFWVRRSSILFVEFEDISR